MKNLIPLIILAALLSACSKSNTGVKYEVTCNSCSLTYSNETEGTEQTKITDNWSYTFEATKGQFLYISAQNNEDEGTVSVKILVNGTTFKQASSSGAYVIATASGSAPE